MKENTKANKQTLHRNISGMSKIDDRVSNIRISPATTQCCKYRVPNINIITAPRLSILKIQKCKYQAYPCILFR
eukprot:g56376.t1